MINISQDVKFNIGQEVYYKKRYKGYKTTIKKIIVRTVISDIVGQATTISYFAIYKYGPYTKMYKNFEEEELFDTKEAVSLSLIPSQKEHIQKQIKTLEKAINSHKKTINVNNKKLDEIKKEELIESLSGL